MPTIITEGALAAKGLGFGSSSAAGAGTYIEDVFSAYLYTGNGATQTVPNGMGLADLPTSAGYAAALSPCYPSSFNRTSYISSTGKIVLPYTNSCASISSTGSVVAQSNIGWNATAVFSDDTDNYLAAKDGGVQPSYSFFYKASASTGTVSNKYTISNINYSTNSIDTSCVIEKDSSGNIFIYGYTRSDGPTFYYYPFLIKLNSSLSLQWYKSIGGGTANNALNEISKSMCLDSSGNIYVVYNDGNTGVLVKFSTSGAVLNSYTWGSAGVLDASSVFVDGSGNIYVGGTNSGYSCVTKLNSSFVVQWSYRWLLSGVAASVYSICTDASGNVYCGDAGGIVVKFNSSGTFQWSRQLGVNGQSGNFQVTSLKIVGSNLCVCAGYGLFGSFPTDGTGTGGYPFVSNGTTYTLYWVNKPLTNNASISISPISYTMNFWILVYTFNTNTNSTTNTVTTSTTVNNFSASTSTGGGMVWLKDRYFMNNHALYDTTRGVTKQLSSNLTNAQSTPTNGLTAFNSNGFTIGNLSTINQNTDNCVSWTFRKQPKFFDIVTYTGTGANRTIAHNLGSTPGCIIVKGTSSAGSWYVYHSATTATKFLRLETTDAAATGSTVWNNTSPTSSVFSIGTDGAVNGFGATYVAYLFASNAGGFGASGTENVITCGSVVSDGSGLASVNLGWEPQFLLLKPATTDQSWQIVDNTRGLFSSSNFGTLQGITPVLFPNADAGENYFGNLAGVTSTGFNLGSNATGGSSQTIIYIAIRRGPMKTPTVGTTVFKPTATSVSTGTAVTTGFISDSQWANLLAGNTYNTTITDRLRAISSVPGDPKYTKALYTSLTSAEDYTANEYATGLNNTGWVQGSYATSSSTIRYDFKRAPGFFDEVCYTGTGANTTQTHNLGVVPELMIIKKRNTGTVSDSWLTYSAYVSNPTTNRLVLNGDFAANINSALFWNSTAPTSTVFSLGTYAAGNEAGLNFVAYLFASCPGVSKVGSYSGTGATQTINCGFTGGARFVLIKRTDSTGDWYAWDTARGMVAGTDPYILLNTNTAEVNTNSVYTTGVGFQIVSTAAGINASGGTYIYLAIA